MSSLRSHSIGCYWRQTHHGAASRRRQPAIRTFQTQLRCPRPRRSSRGPTRASRGGMNPATLSPSRTSSSPSSAFRWKRSSRLPGEIRSGYTFPGPRIRRRDSSRALAIRVADGDRRGQHTARRPFADPIRFADASWLKMRLPQAVAACGTSGQRGTSFRRSSPHLRT